MSSAKVNVVIVERPSSNGSGETQCRVYSEERREEFLDEFSRLTKQTPKLWITLWAIEIDEDRPWFFERAGQQMPLGGVS